MNTINANLTLMFVRLINKSLSEYVYPAALVDLHWEFCATIKGIQVSNYNILILLEIY